MSAYTHFRQLWGVGILQYFVWIYFSFPFGGPRMWAYSFTRLPWTSRTWGTALDGFLMPEFEEMIRWWCRWCLIVTDSPHTSHTQRTISLLKSSSPAAVAENLLSLSPFTRPHLHESIRAIEQSQVPDGSGLRFEILARKMDLLNFCLMYAFPNWPIIDPNFKLFQCTKKLQIYTWYL